MYVVCHEEQLVGRAVRNQCLPVHGVSDGAALPRRIAKFDAEAGLSMMSCVTSIRDAAAKNRLSRRSALNALFRASSSIRFMSCAWS